MAGDIGSAERCMNAVRKLQEELGKARKTLINSETCVVNRVTMQAQLEYLQDHLPDTIPKAAEIVRQEETIRLETEQKRTEIIEGAQTQAQNMVNEATQSSRQVVEQAQRDAQSLMERANQEANACVDAARKEAARLMEDAEKKARELIEEENIVRRARVECDELRENAQRDAADLHRKTLNYIDSLLADTDRRLSELISSVRTERNEIRNHM